MIRKNILLIVTVLLVLFGCTAEEHTEGARFVKVRGVDTIRRRNKAIHTRYQSGQLAQSRRIYVRIQSHQQCVDDRPDVA